VTTAVTRPETLREAFLGKRVLLTGHTGFKGAWLTIWLSNLGAHVTGFALPAEPRSLFAEAGINSFCRHIEGDLCARRAVVSLVAELAPDFIFHLAAQSLVRRGYREPQETFGTNVLGTANVLEAVRLADRPCAVVIVTSDKCYENDGRTTPYGEGDRLGGRDPYSASKAAAEIVVSAYRASFFPPERLEDHGVALASARSGNVIGGGDWSEDRLLPDAIRALERQQPISVRNPRSVRPWQHVLDPLSGYLLLGSRLASGSPDDRASHCEAWNFGPDSSSARTVADVIAETIRSWGTGSWRDASDASAPHEAAHLALSIDKARQRLGWAPRWDFREAVGRTVTWYRLAQNAGERQQAELCLAQIREYANIAVGSGAPS